MRGALVLGGLLVACNALAADPAARMAYCNAEADRQGYPPAGDERKAAIKACLQHPAPSEVAAAAQAKKPGATLGMTPAEVRDRSSWGKPESVNRTVTAGHVREQWVYPGGFLYFDNGVLTAIQN